MGRAHHVAFEFDDEVCRHRSFHLAAGWAKLTQSPVYLGTPLYIYVVFFSYMIHAMNEHRIFGFACQTFDEGKANTNEIMQILFFNRDLLEIWSGERLIPSTFAHLKCMYPDLATASRTCSAVRIVHHFLM